MQDAPTNAMRDRTVIAVAHRLSPSKHAHQIIVLHEGNIIETGTHETLLAKAGVYAKMIALQQLT